MGPVTACIPDPDPGELFLQDMDIQLFGLNGTPGDTVPPMNGFVDNYVRQTATDPRPDPASVMHYFMPKQVPVLSTLAKAFGVSDQWHASAPCQTWPNRFFAHTATAGGYVDNSPPHFPYDHMPPPLAVAPDALRTPDGFAFNRYGVRVPAVIISPYMPPGGIIRSSETGLPHHGPPYPFDHTSILATLRKLFDLGAPLTARDAVAPDLMSALSLENPDNDGPPSVDPGGPTPSSEEIAKSAAAPPNHMQKSLCAMAAHLPPSPATAGAHLSAMASPTAARGATAGPASSSETKLYAANRLKSFLT